MPFDISPPSNVLVPFSLEISPISGTQNTKNCKGFFKISPGSNLTAPLGWMPISVDISPLALYIEVMYYNLTLLFYHLY